MSYYIYGGGTPLGNFKFKKFLSTPMVRPFNIYKNYINMHACAWLALPVTFH